MIAVEKRDKSPSQDAEPSNFREIKKGDSVKFECNICKKRFPKLAGVNGLVKRVHEKKDSNQSQKKRKTAAEFFGDDDDQEKSQKLEDEDESDEEFLKEIENYWDNTTEGTRDEDTVTRENYEMPSQFPSQ